MLYLHLQKKTIMLLYLGELKPLAPFGESPTPYFACGDFKGGN
jgi:hypothetical protein